MFISATNLYVSHMWYCKSVTHTPTQLFTHFMNIAFAKRAESVAKWRLVLRLCALGGTLLLARFLFAGYSPVHPTVGHESFEWLRGDAETVRGWVSMNRWAMRREWWIGQERERGTLQHVTT
jgi:hypothetical protein